MSTISDEGRKRALDEYGVRLLPDADERSHLIAASKNWGPFTEGDYVTIDVTEESYLVTGSSAATVATTSGVKLPAGVHDFAVPTGVTHVALISSISGATAAVWKS